MAVATKTRTCECSTALHDPKDHEWLLSVEGDFENCALCWSGWSLWDGLDHDEGEESQLPPCDLLMFISEHSWSNPVRMYQLGLLLSVDIYERLRYRK